ncbi:MAG TPA: FG-GAP-like repeat-containing protein [Polyangiaceae bacterium]|nr:FG-GAP-like repeat-containing protein [Polyangiaceae bacterium]
MSIDRTLRVNAVGAMVVWLLSACSGGPSDVVFQADAGVSDVSQEANAGAGGVSGSGGTGGASAAGAAGTAGVAGIAGEAGHGAAPEDGGPDVSFTDVANEKEVGFEYDAPPCSTGCDGGVCINGACCPLADACGDECCDTGQVCSFQHCVVPGTICIDATDCETDEYCEYSLGAPPQVPDAGTCVGGLSPATGRCLPKPPQCDPGVELVPGEPITCLPVCEHRPQPGSFAPIVKAHWNKKDIMMAPVVIQLDDDNCDGVVDERDIPEMVFSTFDGGDYNHNGTLWAISIVDGQIVEKWSFKPTTDAIHPGRSIAAGNIDGNPGNEIVVCTDNGKVRAVDADGTPLWISGAGGCDMPSLGDLDGDGMPEVVVEGRILNGVDGSLKATMTPGPVGSNIVLSDMDGDGLLDIISPAGIWGGDGQRKAESKIAGTYVAIGDFDLDGIPEVASINKSNHTLSVWRYDPSEPSGAKVLRTGIDINGTWPNTCPVGSSGHTTGGGPPTIADFDGDGVPDVAVAGGIGYAVIDGTKILDPLVPANQTNLWLGKTQDCSSAATGSSVFDFEGDGKAEVVYSDEQYLRVYDGTNGDVLFQECNTTGTLFEYPLVADVDNDGHADLIVIANAYSGITCPKDGSKQRGLRVFGTNTGRWVRTRRVWNQHAYHVTNVEEDGTIPTQEAPNWTQQRLNNFRQNVQPLGEFGAPDLIVQVLPPPCNTEYALYARVTNIGQASVPAGVVVGFYANDPLAGGTLLGSAVTSHPLYPAENEIVSYPYPNPPPGLSNGTTPLYAVVDDGNPPHAWVECRTDNNTGGPASGKCLGGGS